MTRTRQVRVLVNPRSGLPWSFDDLREAFDRHWDVPGTEVTYQFCQSAQDGQDKARRAVDQGVDILLVAGGDGTINTVGRVLAGTEVTLGVLPTGSGNGFARHFNIPLTPAKAVAALSRGTVRRIDVGCAAERFFFVTCSMAWDAALVQSFNKSPFRGVIPYAFAGVQEFFQYVPQPIAVELDSGEVLEFADPLFFTIANLSQYGGGAKIAPQAKEDDGLLELIVALRADLPKLILSLHRLFDGSAHTAPGVVARRFRRLKVRRPRRAPVQMDGELVEMPRDIDVEVHPRILRVLLPGLKTKG